MGDRLLTAQEAADILSLSYRTIKRLIAGNEIPHIRINRNIRFDKIELEKWLKTRSVKVS